ncbi:hypothetical protein CPB86DRAFT_792908 [Serendipita vermifera]|nr:hypothetical protein CPB86DRAFT_792908 [Serendipita vermifera]
MSYYSLTPELEIGTGKENGWPWRSSSSTSIGPPPPPMPSLTTHPPLRLQRKPVAGTTLPEIRANADSPPEMMMEDTPSPPHQPTSSREPTPEEQSFPCPYCPAIFKKVGHLNRHAFKHSGTRFACEIPGCGKTFSRLDNMRTHMKHMHPPPSSFARKHGQGSPSALSIERRSKETGQARKGTLYPGNRERNQE